jgi:DNA-binding transcriptional MerR regulator
MRIGAVAEQVGVRMSLIRYCERIGLLPADERASGQPIRRSAVSRW